jgi:hypothetical protein
VEWTPFCHAVPASKFLMVCYLKEKTFELCVSIIGCVWSFITYTGKDSVLQFPMISSDMNKTIVILQILAEPLNCKGCTIWMGRF